jgi:hypothetical protein
MARIYNGALIAPGAGMDSFNLMRAFRRIVERGGWPALPKTWACRPPA